MTITDELLAWSGWRWLVGMVEVVAGAVCVSVLDSEPWQWAVDGSLTEAEGDDARPDLGHAGTLGLIEHVLLREAWGPDATIEVVRFPDGEGFVHVEIGFTVVRSRCREPFADALVNACLAAPDRGDR